MGTGITAQTLYVNLLAWCVASASCFGAMWILMRRHDPALAPSVIYSLGLWLFLIAGLPLAIGRGFYGNGYYWALALGCLPFVVPILFVTRRKGSSEFVPAALRSGRIILLWLWALAVAGVAVYVLRHGKPPIFESGGLTRSAEFYELRMSATYTSAFSDFELFFYTIPSLAVVLGHILYRAGELRGKWNLFSIFLAVALGSMFLHKSKGLYILATLVLVDACLGVLSKRKFVIAFLLGVGLVLGWYMFYMRGYPLPTIGRAILFRMTTAYILSLDFVLQNFPNSWPYLGGTTLPNPRGLLPFDPVSLSRFVMLQRNLNASGAFPVPSLGEGYANFGWLGATVFSGLLTFWVLALIRAYRAARRTPVAFAAWVLLSVGVSDASKQGLGTVLDLKLLVLIAVILASDSIMRQLSLGRRRFGGHMAVGAPPSP